MMTSRFKDRVLSFCLAIGIGLGATPAVRATDVPMAVWPGGDDYIISLMHLALKAEGHGHTLVTVPNTLPQSRTLRDLADRTAPFKVVFSGHSREREATLRQIDIPLYRGLLGYRMLAIRADRAGDFKAIHSFEDLKAISFGSSAHWPDTPILKGAGLTVVTAPSDTLWTMLDRGRFDAFPRGMNEVAQELADIEKRGDMVPMMIEPTVMIAYPLPMFFYVAREDEALAQTIEAGLKAAYANGSFRALFESQPSVQAALKEFAAHKRLVFRLDNPDVSDRVKAIPAPYWQTLEGETVDLP